MADIGALYVRILADMKTFGADLKSKMTKAEGDATSTGKKVGGGFGKGLATAATAFAGLAVVDYMKHAGEAASELNVDIGRTEDVFGRAGAAVVDWSKKSAQGLGLSQDEALTLANRLGTMYGSMGMSSKGAAQLSENAIKLGTDLATFYKKDPATGINAIRMASLGATRGLKQFGIVIDKTAVSAQAVRMGLGKTTVDVGKLGRAQDAAAKASSHIVTAQNSARIALMTYNEAVLKHGKNSDQAQKALIKFQSAQEKVRAAHQASAAAQRRVNEVMKGGKTVLTAAEKAQATYALIAQKAGKAQGAFAKEGGSLEIQNRKTRAEFKNMQASLGQALLPVMTKVGNIIATQVAPALAKMADFVGRNRRVMVPLIGSLAAFVAVVKGAKAISNFAKDIGGVVKAVKSMELGQKLAAGATKVWSAVQAVFNAIMAANPIVLVVLAIAALIAIIVIAYMKVGWFRAGVQAAFGAVAAAAQWVWQKVVAAFHWIVNAISGVLSWLRRNWPLIIAILLGPIGIVGLLIIKNFSRIRDFVTGAWRGMLNVIRSVAGAIANFVSTWIGRIVGFFTGLPGALIHFGAEMIGGFLRGITNAWTNVTQFFANIGTGIKNTIGNVGSWLLNIGHDLIMGLVHGIENAWHFVTDKLSDLASHLPGFIKGPLHIGSPSRVFANDVGQWISRGIAAGITEHGGAVKSALNKLPLDVYAAGGAGGPGSRVTVAKSAPTVENLYVQALDARQLAGAVADRLAYEELRSARL